MPITATQGTILANLLHELRPDWPVASLVAHLKGHVDHPKPYADIVIAAVTTATQRQARTPLLIWDLGPHWPVHADEPAPQGPACPDHSTFDAATCPACLGDVKAGDRPRDMVGRHYAPAATHDEAPPVCEDHGSAPAGECPTCWAEVEAGTRARRWIGRTAPAVEVQG